MSRCQCTSPSSGLALPVLSRWAVKLSSLENSLHHFCLLWVLLSLKSFHAQRLSGDISITACIRKIRTSGTQICGEWWQEPPTAELSEWVKHPTHENVSLRETALLEETIPSFWLQGFFFHVSWGRHTLSQCHAWVSSSQEWNSLKINVHDRRTNLCGFNAQNYEYYSVFLIRLWADLK